MQKIILICLLTIILSQNKGYIRRSFFEKNILVSTSLEVGKKATANMIKSSFENSNYCEIYPLEIFSQKDSGINFKVVFAAILQEIKPTIFTVSIFYPDENSNENLQFKGIVSKNNTAPISFESMGSITELLKKEYSNDVELVFFYCYSDILFESAKDYIYFLKLYIQKDDYAFVYTDNENNYYLSYVIKDYNIIYNIN